MIYLVSGKRNSGKTSYLKDLVETLDACDGVLSVKKFRKDIFLGYDLYHIANQDHYSYIALADQTAVDLEQDYFLGKFVFKAQGIERGKAILKRAMTLGVDVVIDEIAQMELQGQIFYDEVCRGVALQKEGCSWDLYLVVRDGLLEDLVEKFDIKSYKLIKV